MVRTGEKVAMKFTTAEPRAAKEYRMYTYLKAVNNTDVKKYGIPSVHYYGKWGEFFMIAVTLLDANIKSKIGSLRELDGLIICREFVSKTDVLSSSADQVNLFRNLIKVKASKYMHGRGVRHDDIKPENIMVRKNKVFIIG